LRVRASQGSWAASRVQPEVAVARATAIRHEAFVNARVLSVPLQASIDDRLKAAPERAPRKRRSGCIGPCEVGVVG
jgi:hypothetical protein